MAEVRAAIEATLSSDAGTRNGAENYLRSVERSAGFLTAVLVLATAQESQSHVQQAAAVYLKNTIKRLCSDMENTQNSTQDAAGTPNGNISAALPHPDAQQMMSALPAAVIGSQPVVRRQLAQVLAIIAERISLQSWPQLLPELVAAMSSATAAIQQHTQQQPAADPTAPAWGALQAVADALGALFARFQFTFRSDALFSEIKYVLTVVQAPLTAAFQLACGEALSGNNAPPARVRALNAADSIVVVFHALCWQDLPEFFEDNLATWVREFVRLLSMLDNLDGDSNDDDAPGALERTQANVLETCELFERKYGEEFRSSLPDVVSACWALLVARGSAPKYDSVATRGIAMLTTVARSPDFGLFGDSATLQQICEKVVLPNVELREEDEELFEDNPVEYVRRDMEGSDAESRRRSAVELVKGLLVHYEAPVTQTLSTYVAAMLARYAADADSGWKAKDAAVYVVTALGWKAGTQASGATRTSALVDVVEFYRTHVAPEFMCIVSSPASAKPILVADALRFATMFRNQLPPDLVQSLVTHCVTLIAAAGAPIVVHAYAAICVERALTMKDTTTGAARFGKQQLGAAPDVLPALVSALLARVNGNESTAAPAAGASSFENEYAMRCVLRVVVCSQELIIPHSKTILVALHTALARVSASPSNPRFNHYLFETIAALVRVAAGVSQQQQQQQQQQNGMAEQNLRMVEAALLEPFQSILANDMLEFAPYVLQILAQMLNAHAAITAAVAPVPDTFHALLPALLTQSLWDRSSYVPGMVQFLQAYIRVSGDKLSSEGKLGAVLGIFQQLVARKAQDHFGMGLLITMLDAYGMEVMGAFVKDIVRVLMMRLQSAKTAKFTNKLLSALSVMVIKYGTACVVDAMDALQPQLLATLLQQVWLKDVPAMPNAVDRKTCALGAASMITSAQFAHEPYSSLLAPMLESALVLLEASPTAAAANGRAADADEGEPVGASGVDASAVDSSVAYSQLSHTGARDEAARDVFRTIDARAHTAAALAAWSRSNPGKLEQLARDQLSQSASQALSTYLSSASNGTSAHG